MEYSPELRATLDYIYSFTMNGRKNRKKTDSSRLPTLAVMEALMDYIGHPHAEYKVIHIAGTKGKGSTANFIANTLIAAGYKVGLFTSPHLFDFSERIQVNGKLIPHENVIEIVESLKPFCEDTPEINTFEIITAMAFEYFRMQKVDYAVVEVGLGGRFDATNVVNPVLSVITSISFDHMDLLGDTLEQIAFEKAGIIKTGVPIVVGKQFEAAHQVLKEVAQERQAPFIDAIDVSLTTLQNLDHGHRVIVNTNDGVSVEFEIPLFGFHQVENALLAYSALVHLVKLGLRMKPADIQTGFKNVHWPARFEVISQKPLVIIDGAHNGDSIRRVIETLRLKYPDYRYHLVFGVSTGKDIESMLGQLLPAVESCIFTRSSHPKSEEPTALVQLAKQMGYSTSSNDTVEEAMQEAVKGLQNSKTLLLCTGSLFLAAAVSDVWKAMNSEMKE